MHAMTPNNQFQRSVNSRLRGLSPPADLERWASPPATDILPRAAIGHLEACKRTLELHYHSVCVDLVGMSARRVLRITIVLTGSSGE